MIYWHETSIEQEFLTVDELNLLKELRKT